MIPIKTTIDSQVVTMTSLEIVDFINVHRKSKAEEAGVPFPSKGFAELRHDHFCTKAIEVLGKDNAPKFLGTQIYGNNNMREIFVFPKREACLMAMSYSYEIQAEVFDRMTALEQEKINNPVHLLNDPATLRNLLHGYTEKVMTLEAKVQEQAPKVAALERIAIADGEVCLQTAGKLLRQPPNKFIAWLRSVGGWIFKRPGSKHNSAYAEKINAGYLAVRQTITKKPDGSDHVHEQVVVTPKGLVKLSQMLGVSIDGDLFGA